MCCENFATAAGLGSLGGRRTVTTWSWPGSPPRAHLSISRRKGSTFGGLRHRWVYDLKAAGMSIAQEHGAPQAVVAAISHDPKTVVGGYSRFSWSARCEAVMALYRALSGARQLSLL